MPTRRQFIGGLAAGAGAASLGSIARASTPTRLVVVELRGGWDLGLSLRPERSAAWSRLAPEVRARGVRHVEGLAFGPALPREFLELAPRTTIVHGLDVETHDHDAALERWRASRPILSGGSAIEHLAIQTRGWGRAALEARCSADVEAALCFGSTVPGLMPVRRDAGLARRFRSGGGDGVELTARALVTCATRNVTLQLADDLDHHGPGWATQHPAALERAFGDVTRLVRRFDQLGLSHDTTVVVMSELGRARELNAHGGRDHDSTTAAVVIAPGPRRALVDVCGAGPEALWAHLRLG